MTNKYYFCRKCGEICDVERMHEGNLPVYCFQTLNIRSKKNAR